MKHLIGLLFCFGFLLLAGSTQTKAHAEPQKEMQTILFDAVGSEGQAKNLTIQDDKGINMAQPSKYQLLEIVKLRETIQQTRLTAHEGLFYRYVPECPVQYINKKTGKYYSNYLQCPHPKRWQSNFSI